MKALSTSRITGDEEFHYLSEDIDRETKKDEVNLLSLNEKARRVEMDDEKVRENQRDTERKLRKSPEEIITQISIHDAPGKKLASAVAKASNNQSPTNINASTGDDPAAKEPG